MEYDPTEQFREDPGEMELSPEFQAQMQLQQQSEEMPLTPTGEQPEPAPQAEVSTEPQPEEPAPEPFDSSKDFSYYAAQGMTRSEWTRNRLQNMRVGGELEAFADDPRSTSEFALSIPTSLLDFGVDTLNLIPGVNIPKITPFQNEIAQATREISSVVTPTILLGRAGNQAGASAHSRVNWNIGNNKFVQWMGNRGVEAAAGTIVGAVSSEYTEDNLAGMLKKKWPRTYDFIPDSMATLDTDGEDLKRQKNIYEDLGMGFVTDLTIGAFKFVDALASTRGALSESNRLVGETPQARAWLTENQPPKVLDGETVEDVVTRSAIKQEEALDEVGMYNISTSLDLSQPLKGVHDMYDYTEVGVRTVDDFGVVGAAIDSARIARNLDTVHGRLGNVISEPALKYSVTNPGGAEDVVLGLADQLHKAGPIGMDGRNWKVTFDDVMDANEDLAIQLFDPRMTKEDMRKVLEPYIVRADDGTERLVEDGFAMASKALRNFGEELTNMDVARAQSILAGSLSGRVSDLSEGARLMSGTSAVHEAQEKIVDMLQYISQLSATAKYYKNRKMGLIQQVANGFRNIEGYNEATVLGAGEVAERVFKDSERFANSMRQIAANQPQLMDQFLLAYELTDGNIDTIIKMNRWIDEMTVDIGKGLINLNPEVQNKIVAGVWSNIYNNILGPLSAIKALVGNFGGIIAQPTAHFAGALMAADLKGIQRGWVAYSSLGETMQRAMPYAGDVFMRASRNPESVKSGTRIDLLMQSEREIEFLKKAAATQAAEGNHGLQYIVNQIELLNDFAKDPALRFGPNAMTAMDGFTGVFNASAEARFRAMDELIAAGKPITKENVKPIADKYYSQMFSPDGLLQDDAVKYATSEMALNLDTPIARGLDDLTRIIPAVKPFMMFNATSINSIDIMGKYGPWAPWQRDVNELVYTRLDDLLLDEDRVTELLKARGFDVSSMDVIAKQERLTDLKYQARGRKAIGAVAMLGVYNLLMNDRITGDGFYDKELQMARVKNSNWKPRSIKGPDGKYYSYAQFGPIADWLALAANIGDNFDSIGEASMENLSQKMSFILSAAITNRTTLSTVKPLMDMTSGNGAAVNRWAAGFVNGLGPMAALRGDFSRILSEGLLEVESDFMSQLNNRNRFVGALFNTQQAYVYSPVTGRKPNGYGMMQRLYNAYSPIQVHPEQTPEEKFLQDVEFDINTTFRSKNGVRLLPQERSELFRLMGERGFFRDAIREIMRDAGNWDSIQKLRNLRSQGFTSTDVDLKEWHDIHARLSQARRQAEDIAYSEMDADMYAAIELRQQVEDLKAESARMGEVFDPSILNTRY
jgi:hypothetical protein